MESASAGRARRGGPQGPSMNNRPVIGPLATATLVVALLYYGKTIFMPLTVSLFVIAVVWPVQAALQRRMPRLFALLITLSLTIFVIAMISSLSVWGFSELAQWLFANAGRYQAIYSNW